MNANDKTLVAKIEKTLRGTAVMTLEPGYDVKHTIQGYEVRSHANRSNVVSVPDANALLVIMRGLATRRQILNAVQFLLDVYGTLEVTLPELETQLRKADDMRLYRSL